MKSINNFNNNNSSNKPIYIKWFKTKIYICVIIHKILLIILTDNKI